MPEPVSLIIATGVPCASTTAMVVPPAYSAPTAVTGVVNVNRPGGPRAALDGGAGRAHRGPALGVAGPDHHAAGIGAHELDPDPAARGILVDRHRRARGDARDAIPAGLEVDLRGGPDIAREPELGGRERPVVRRARRGVAGAVERSTIDRRVARRRRSVRDHLLDLPAARREHHAEDHISAGNSMAPERISAIGPRASGIAGRPSVTPIRSHRAHAEDKAAGRARSRDVAIARLRDCAIGLRDCAIAAS